MTRIAISVLSLLLFAEHGATAQDQPLKIDCLDPSQVQVASEAYDAYCSRCHEPGLLARNWFSTRGTGDDAVHALEAFLDSHGGCPHNHHELLARWLAEQAGGN